MIKFTKRSSFNKYAGYIENSRAIWTRYTSMINGIFNWNLFDDVCVVSKFRSFIILVSILAKIIRRGTILAYIIGISPTVNLMLICFT